MPLSATTVVEFYRRRSVPYYVRVASGLRRERAAHTRLYALVQARTAVPLDGAGDVVCDGARFVQADEM